ncbi:MAG: putative ABC transporter ATP-binding protein [Candidatus Heimdallarchaeota archaeon LC_3]|nr:MAG: putative ABC transporter ATP-binding protein [Candidatus Heimdallarchaeota archaeon LC_3]
MPYLELEDIIKVYENRTKNLRVPALRGLSLSIKQSEFISIVGPSGSGKSTLLKLIAGHELPTSGRLFLESVGDISGLKGKELRKYRQKTIGFLSQFAPDNLIPSWSAKNNILLPMKIFKSYNREEYQKRPMELLKILNMEEKLLVKAGKLSGGEQQKLGLAVAIANNPLILLADEPTGELDRKNSESILTHMRDLNQEMGTTIIIVTHDKMFVEKTEKSYLIRNGRI